MLKKFFVTILLFFPLSFASASTLFFDLPKNEYAPGENFFADLKIDNVSACVNTIKAQVKFPVDKMEFLDFLDGESFLSLWIEKPNTKISKSINKTGILNFAGGIPGGYCGKVPGDPGNSNIIARLVFKLKDSLSQDEILSLKIASSTQVLLNDGFGGEDALALKDFKIKIKESSSSPQYEWERVVKTDKIKPEPFIIALHQNPKMFDGKYYINFSTVDKQTGIDHYEVLEIKKGEQVGAMPKQSFWDKILGNKKETPHWEIASMPYVLKDQELKSIIKVRAVDKAGNVREVEYVPDKSYLAKKEQKKSLLYIFSIIGVSALFIMLIIVFFNHKKIS